MEPTSSAFTFPECPKLLYAGVGVHGGDLRCERFLLEEGIWALHAYPYEAEIEWKGHRQRIEPGTVGLTPADVPVFYYFQGPSQHRYAHFRVAAEAASTPFLLRNPELYARVWEDVGRLRTLQHARPRHAEIMLWNLLLSLEDAAQCRTQSTRRHPALEAALILIEEEMDRPLNASALARRAGVSINHLIRLFRENYGLPVGAYLRQRRLERATHLLRHTDLPVKSIAGSIGISDLHAFNKLIRHHYGKSPRTLRPLRHAPRPAGPCAPEPPKSDPPQNGG